MFSRRPEKETPLLNGAGFLLILRPDLADRSNSLTKEKISSILNEKFQTASAEYASSGQSPFPIGGSLFFPEDNHQ
jgi:hypothetical protein